MPGLAAHLAGRECHASLQFHADCPLCLTERLQGHLSQAPLVPRRAVAGVAAALLVATPAVTQASGGTAVAQAEDGDDEPDDLGGSVESVGSSDMPGDAVPAGGGSPPVPPAAPPSGAVIDDVGDSGDPPAPAAPPQPVAPAQAPPPGETIAGAQAPVAVEPARVPPAAPPPVPQPPPPQPTARPDTPERPSAPPQERTEPARDGKARSQARRMADPATVARAGPAPIVRAVPAPVAQGDPPSAPVAPARAHAASSALEIPNGARTHVVLRGESLWSIAKALLPDGAPAAQVAGMVSRLWDLNADRIQTGDPDLLPAGIELRLP